MATSILITQCLQRDFVDPLLPHDPLPNRLHVGYAESLRLLGHDPLAGPIAQLMGWARAQSPGELEIVHIRDWHDRDDPRQRDHLRMFGDHCLRGTPGAQLILDLDTGLNGRANERPIDSIALNDFQDTTLGETLDAIARRATQPLRVGVVGVWTEAKVSFLLYDLKTRLGLKELATCSALTASASRAQHFNALEQLSRILGINVFDTVGDFTAWLNPAGQRRLPCETKPFGHHVTIRGAGADVPALATEDQNIVGYLYRDSSSVMLEPLSGGFSGALVFKASSHDALGHQQAPSVVKLGGNKLIGAERVAFERVEEILGNNAPSVRGFAELGARAGIKYSFAAMGQGKVCSLKSLFDQNCAPEKLESVLRCTYGEVLRPFYSAARFDRMPLLEHYGFSAKFAVGVRENVERIAGQAGRRERLEFPGGYSAANVCQFYESFIANHQPDPGESHFVSYVHGDLNGANILVDGRDNVWVIDFFHTAPGHVLKDLAKLENDILYIFTPIPDEKTLAEALLITAELRKVEDLRQPLPEKLDGLRSPHLLRAWAMVRTLREFVGEYCRIDRNPAQMDVALLRYGVHTLSFDESSPLQKQWALAASCGLAEDIVATHQAEEALRLDWMDLSQSGKAVTGRLGVTICPGRRDRGRDLRADLDVFSRERVTRVACMITDAELEWAGVRHLGGTMSARGIQFRHAPVPDQGAPELPVAAALVQWIRSALDSGENVVVHCMGGLGRSGTIAACVAAAYGLSAETAIAEIRRCRGPRAIETQAQVEFVKTFAKSLTVK